jgi:hypothetical protein
MIIERAGTAAGRPQSFARRSVGKGCRGLQHEPPNPEYRPGFLRDETDLQPLPSGTFQKTLGCLIAAPQASAALARLSPSISARA